MKAAPWILLLALLGATSSATAFGDFVFKTPSLSEGGWYSFTLTNVSAETSVNVVAQLGPPSMSGVHIFAADGRAIAAWFGERGDAGSDVRVRNESANIDSRPVNDPGRPQNFFAGAGVIFGEPVEKIYVVGWAAGPRINWHLTIDSPTFIEPVEMLSGASSYYYDGSEWGGANGHVATGGRTASVGFGTQKQLNVSGTFLGRFGLHGNGVTAGELTMSGPAGELLCPCMFPNVIGDEVIGAGSYDLNWTGASVRTASPLFSGADVEIKGLTIL